MAAKKKEISEEGIAAVLDALVSCGDAERIVGADGRVSYRLTAQGNARAEAMIRKAGGDPDALKAQIKAQRQGLLQ